MSRFGNHPRLVIDKKKKRQSPVDSEPMPMTRKNYRDKLRSLPMTLFYMSIKDGQIQEHNLSREEAELYIGTDILVAPQRNFHVVRTPKMAK